MQKIQTFIIRFSKDEAKKIANMTENSIMSYYDSVEVNDEDRKLMNSLSSNETTYSEESFKRIMIFFEKIKSLLFNKSTWAKQQYDKAEDKDTNGIIVNEKKFYQVLIETYQNQIYYIGVLKNFFTEETNTEEDET